MYELNGNALPMLLILLFVGTIILMTQKKREKPHLPQTNRPVQVQTQRPHTSRPVQLQTQGTTHQ